MAEMGTPLAFPMLVLVVYQLFRNKTFTTASIHLGRGLWSVVMEWVPEESREISHCLITSQERGDYLCWAGKGSVMARGSLGLIEHQEGSLLQG